MRWGAVLMGPKKRRVVIDDVSLVHFLALRKRFGRGAIGLLTGIPVSALGDGHEALRGLLGHLKDRALCQVLAKWHQKLQGEGYTAQISLMALAAFFLVVDREQRFPRKPKKDDKGVIREDSAMELYDFANSLKDRAMDEDQLRYAYWSLTGKVATVKRNLKKALAEGL
jgi:hypothetical protein